MSITDDLKQITNTTDRRNAAYGAITIDFNIHKNILFTWYIKVITWDQSGGPVLVGIDSSNRKWINSKFCGGFTTHDNNIFYSLESGNGGVYEVSRSGQMYKMIGPGYQSGNTIIMKLNINEKYY